MSGPAEIEFHTARTPVIYVNPDKVYVICNVEGTPTMVVQSRDLAEMFTAVEGGFHYLVPWYGREKFLKDFTDPPKVKYDDYEPDPRNPGGYRYRPKIQRRF